VVPACEACNKEKHEKHWRDFLGVKYKGQERDQRVQRIETFIKQYQYKPNAILHNLAEQLYDKIRDETSRLQRLYVKKVAKLINVRGRRCSAVGRVRS
jgi:hypothetical protein